MLGAGALLGCAMLGVSVLLGPKVPSKLKDSPFECGVPPASSSRQRVSVRFYLVAILFLLFDVEAVFFYPWAVVFNRYLTISQFIVYEMVMFIAIFLVGFFYVWQKGALEWD